MAYGCWKNCCLVVGWLLLVVAGGRWVWTGGYAHTPNIGKEREQAISVSLAGTSLYTLSMVCYHILAR